MGEVLGSISLILGIIGTLLGGLYWLGGRLIKEINKELDKRTIEHYKNFLVRIFNDIENGEKLDDVVIERMKEVYEKYNVLGGNSYIHAKYNELVRKGKIKE